MLYCTVCSKPVATYLGGYLYSQGSYVCVYSTSLLLYVLAAAAGLARLYNFQVARTCLHAMYLTLLASEECVAAFFNKSRR
jgi:hypothetical protein